MPKTDRELLKDQEAGSLNSSGAVDPVGAVAQAHEETFVFLNVAGSPLAEIAYHMRKKCRVKSIVALPAAGLATAAANYVTGTVGKRDAAGANPLAIGSFTTNSTGGAALVAFVPQNIVPNANAEIAAGASLTYALVDNATTTEVAVAVSVTVEYI